MGYILGEKRYWVVAVCRPKYKHKRSNVQEKNAQQIGCSENLNYKQFCTIILLPKYQISVKNFNKCEINTVGYGNNANLPNFSNKI